ncbi:MAG: TIGR02266 family protein [Bradymonadia bacterium]
MTTTNRPTGLAAQLTPSRRRNPRISFEVEVTLESDHNFFTGFSQNISEGGVFVATPHVLPMGTVVEFTFRLAPFPEQVSVRGEVRWTRESNDDTSDAPSGMGLQFVDLHPVMAERINAFIDRKRETIFYDD